VALAVEDGVATTVEVTGAGQASTAAEAVEVELEELEVDDESVEELAEPAAIPSTAAVISAAVASSTKSFWLKMHPPSGSLVVSQVLPFPVSSSSWDY
jgi:hypothetical protein